jgi:pSer/pThr/pTyr-binding forkhead associated (FHA) protein
VKLSVFSGATQLEQFDLGQSVSSEAEELLLYIGRAKSCFIQLDDNRVSREHAQLIWKGGSWHIYNGSDFSVTELNGIAVTEHMPLANGDSITVGPYSIKVSDSGANTRATTGSLVNNIAADKSQDISNDITNTFVQPEDSENEKGSTDQSFDQSEGSEDNYSNSDTSLEPVEEDDPFGLPEEESDYGMSIPEVDDDKTRVLQSFSTVELEMFGEFAPYDRYVVDKPEIYIGRDKNRCQIVLNDSEVSSQHAKITKNILSCVIEDLGSMNGVLLNGARINRSEIVGDDEIIIGSTTLTVRMVSAIAESEKNRLMPVEENQVIEVEEEEEVSGAFDDDTQSDFSDFDEAQSGSKSTSLFSRDSLKDPVKRKKIIYALVGLVLLWVMLDDGGGGKKKSKAVAKGGKSHLLESGQGGGKKKKSKNEIKFEKLSKDQQQFVDASYLLAKEMFEHGKYSESIFELEKVFSVIPDYKNAKQIHVLAKQGLAKLEELERKRQEAIDRKIRKKKTKELTVKATKAVKEHNVPLAEGLFVKIMELDPENFDVPQLKIELDAWKKEKERADLEKAQKEAERKRQLDLLAPGKSYYLQKDWYKAISKLGLFLKNRKLDEDLIAEAAQMLKDSQDKMKSAIGPMLGKARSLREGQDLKGSYEQYMEVLKHDPSHKEALDEMDEIRDILHLRSSKLYREAIIDESLSLFEATKEKLQEVQQISPIDSEYYRKATNKLRKYLD